MSSPAPWSHGPLAVSSNGQFIEHTDGTPFFWLGDTGWLLFSRLDRDEAAVYLNDRKEKGFNVIQVMMVHQLPATNLYGDTFTSLDEIDWSNGPPMSTPDGYWPVMDTMIRLAEERGLYVALVPVWGSLVHEGFLGADCARVYGEWLGHHFCDRPNIIWLNGGDVRGDTKIDVWQALGKAIKANDPNHLMTYHPTGRAQSSTWFHDAEWLDFNMFQSGHRRYDQYTMGTAGDPSHQGNSGADWKGEDNWRYVLEDLALEPRKPTIDGEPSYEAIPQGLHDLSQPVWSDADVRRYAYWSVFAGAFGHTYGNNSVMQMYKPQFKPAYGATALWNDAISDPGSGQMQHLRRLMEQFDYGHGSFAPEIIVGVESGTAPESDEVRYGRLIANKGPDYALVYAYTPQPIVVNSQRALPGATSVKARWFVPSSGEYLQIGTFRSDALPHFDPGGPNEAGNDVVLVLTPDTH